MLSKDILFSLLDNKKKKWLSNVFLNFLIPKKNCTKINVIIIFIK